MKVIFKKVFREIQRIIPYFYIIRARKKWDFFQYKKNCIPFKESSLTTSACNKFYGNDRAVKNALKRRCLKFNELIEHGVYFGDNPVSTNISKPIVYTMGIFRETFLRQKGYQAYSLGPYILYSKHFHSILELKHIKNELGETLLVFPSHSIEGVNVIFDESVFLYEIEKYAIEFDTVLICMYWKDILEGRFRVYKNAGYRIVSAGHRSDPSFLSRLKDLIFLADMTMSNNLGTHVGYSIAMGKPHYIFSQTCLYEGENAENENRNKNMNKLQERILTFQKVFGVYQRSISKEQLDLVRYYWGNF